MFSCILTFIFSGLIYKKLWLEQREIIFLWFTLSIYFKKKVLVSQELELHDQNWKLAFFYGNFQYTSLMLVLRL